VNFYSVLEITILILHLLWIIWILSGWLLTRGRRVLTVLHIASLGWGIAIELGPWPCPLTIAEQWSEARAGQAPYHESFLAHYLGKMIYPDLPETVVAWTGAAVCAAILGIYSVRFLRRHPSV
jgi:hypothetical protein